MYKMNYKVGDLVMLVGPQPGLSAGLTWLPEMDKQLGGPWVIRKVEDGVSVKLQGDPMGFWYSISWLDPYEPDDHEDEPFSLMEALL